MIFILPQCLIKLNCVITFHWNFHCNNYILTYNYKKLYKKSPTHFVQFLLWYDFTKLYYKILSQPVYWHWLDPAILFRFPSLLFLICGCEYMVWSSSGFPHLCSFLYSQLQARHWTVPTSHRRSSPSYTYFLNKQRKIRN